MYTWPERVQTRQYSPSSVGTIGPPRRVNFSIPSSVTERTIRPRVSTCPEIRTVLAGFRPGMVIVTQPFWVMEQGYPSSLPRLSRYSAARPVKPVGLSISSSSLAFWSRSWR